MDWLTQEYIAQQAKKSKRAAINVSIEHHQQIFDAKPKEYVAAIADAAK